MMKNKALIVVAVLLLLPVSWAVYERYWPHMKSIEDWIEDAGSQNVEVRRKAYVALARVKEPSTIPILIDGIRDEEANVSYELSEAVERLCSTHAAAAQELRELLLDSDPFRREWAARALGAIRVGDERTTLNLVGATRDKDSNVRVAAITSLCDILQLEAMPYADVAVRDDVAAVRKAGLECYGQLGADARSAIKRVGELVEDEDRVVRVVAIRTLDKIGGAEAEELLRRALESEHDDVVTYAKHALESN